MHIYTHTQTQTWTHKHTHTEAWDSHLHVNTSRKKRERVKMDGSQTPCKMSHWQEGNQFPTKTYGKPKIHEDLCPAHKFLQEEVTDLLAHDRMPMGTVTDSSFIVCDELLWEEGLA